MFSRPTQELYSFPAVPKGRITKPGRGFNLNALVNIEAEVFVNKASGDSAKDPVHVYRIVKIVPDPATNGWWFCYELQNVQTEGILENLYKEAALKVLPIQKAEEKKEGGGEGSSKGKNEWDAKTLVGGDDGIRDDETLCGDEDNLGRV
ncbi:MAG: hypothetical protein ASARMPREDX12_005275 [Alectoria sarmentosa]|nr:MAG: hypothetical protein ASARMPREDX12_005275 [Alectoria sarmentosa]